MPVSERGPRAARRGMGIALRFGSIKPRFRQVALPMYSSQLSMAEPVDGPGAAAGADQRWRRLVGWLGRHGGAVGVAAVQRLGGDRFHDLRELIWHIVRVEGRR